MRRLIRSSLTAAFLGLLASCAKLPVVENKPVSSALPVPASGPLVTTTRDLAADRAPGDSSFLLLPDAGDALKWRLALIDSARSSIDIQLYLWHAGSSSALVMDHALQAADRGVRVRILVDDFLLTGSETNIAAICRVHPDFEIRVFNPTRVRGSRFGALSEFIANFRELNRRMHNKTFTVDRCMTIVGGRNIGDHYFGMDAKYNFIDLDVLAAGPVVADVSDGFDEFWNSAAAYPGAMLASKRDNDAATVKTARARIRAMVDAESNGKLRSFPKRSTNWNSELSALPAEMVTGRARFLQDDPDPDHDKRQVVQGLSQMVDSHRGKIRFASPYLIPSQNGIDDIAKVSSQGSSIRILTPSLAANNQPIVDGHYAKYRKPLIDAGAGISEMRADPGAEIRALADVAPVRCERVTLHLKAVVGDRNRCFIGSLNLDPRAININTESGLLIDCPPLAGQLADLIDTLSNNRNSWHVTRDANGRLQWESRGEIRNSPPPAKTGARILSWFSGLLPIKNQI